MANTKKVFPVRLDEKMHSVLESAAYSEGKSKHQFILDAIEHEAQKEQEIIKIRKLIGRALNAIDGDYDGDVRSDLMNWLINS